ncbi:MAG: WhiB family transcriptional regulator [Acidimicrobiia bacterium]|nr:WhiB family transcriptional regulator [Acidimicrobiia bacterium]
MDLTTTETRGAAPGWMDLANCVDVDADVMFPDPGADPSGALEVCAGCDVREACLAHALANGERYGVWGGRTADQRVNLLGFRRPARRRHARRTTAVGPLAPVG